MSKLGFLTALVTCLSLSGACRAAEPFSSDTAMSAEITHPCERGRHQAKVLLAPTQNLGLQSYALTAMK